MPAIVRMVWKVVFDAIWHFSDDDGWAMASHVALSALMAVFPFLIFAGITALVFGAGLYAWHRTERGAYAVETAIAANDLNWAV